MQTEPSARDAAVHKQLLIPKRTTPSVNKYAEGAICKGQQRSQTIINSKTDDTIRK